MKSPLQVRRYYFNNISIKSNDKPEKSQDKEQKAVDFETTLNTKNDGDIYLVNLLLSLMPTPDGPGFPYSILIEAEGEFAVASAWPEDEKEKLAVTNGGAILISAAREQIANLTGRARHGVFLLPAVDLNNFVTEDKE